uniref:Protein C' n=2 Tax=Vesicular stomatitis Indiana virus (strain 94GUB Central America) TaxID=434489 RepID=C_VSIVC|nr:RecName: Full=Protein C' [Vesicular stomatitis Indiana virus (strain 94GUB Central America)]
MRLKHNGRKSPIMNCSKRTDRKSILSPLIFRQQMILIQNLNQKLKTIKACLYQTWKLSRLKALYRSL